MERDLVPLGIRERHVLANGSIEGAEGRYVPIAQFQDRRLEVVDLEERAGSRAGRAADPAGDARGRRLEIERVTRITAPASVDRRTRAAISVAAERLDIRRL